MTAARFLEQLLAPHPTFRLPEIELVDARDQAVEVPMGLPHLAFRRLPLVEAPCMFLGEDGHVPLLPIALGPDFARAIVGPSLLAAQLLAPLQELPPAVRSLLEPDSTLDADLAETVDFAPQRLHALEHRGELDAARVGLG